MTEKIHVDEEDPDTDVEDLFFEPRDVAIRTDKWVTEEFKVFELLGRGKFGEVMRCAEKTTGDVYAAKFIPTPTPQDKEEVKNEVMIMKQLQHKRLLQLYDTFSCRDQMCLVLEAILGGELFDRVICEEFVLSEKACVCFTRQICEGVQYMHSNNIIHLDMKPENILCLTKQGNRIKIIDFGLAREYNTKKDLRVLFGTPEFMAPEVVNYEPISFSTDMWSIGVICYVLLSGLSPFMGDQDGDTLTNVIKCDYDFNYKEFDEITEAAKDFIEKLLIVEKKKRMTASQCLEHPWLKRSDREPSPLLVENKEQLKHYVYRRKWQKGINAVIALRRMGYDLQRIVNTNLADNPELKSILPPKPKMVNVGQFFNKGKENFIKKEKVFNAIMNKCDKQKEQTCVTLKGSSLAVKDTSAKQQSTASGGGVSERTGKGTGTAGARGSSATHKEANAAASKQQDEKPTVGRFGLNKNGLKRVGFGGCVKDMAGKLDNTTSAAGIAVAAGTEKCDNGVVVVKNNGVRKKNTPGGMDNGKPLKAPTKVCDNNSSTATKKNNPGAVDNNKLLKAPSKVCDNTNSSTTKKTVVKDSLKVHAKRERFMNKNLDVQSHLFPKLNRNVIIVEKGASAAASDDSESSSRCSSSKIDSSESTDGTDSHNTSTTSEDCMSISTISEDGDICIPVPSMDCLDTTLSGRLEDNYRNRVSQKRTSSGASYSSDSSDSVRDENKNKVDRKKKAGLTPQSPPTPPPLSIIDRIRAFESSEFSKPPIPPKPEEMKFKVKEMPFHPKRWHKGNDRYVVVNRIQDALKFFTVEDQRELISSGYSRSRENSPQVTPV